MRALVDSRAQYDFGQHKIDSLPRQCLDCDVLFACNGECPKNRRLPGVDGDHARNHLCDGLYAFFHHVDAPMRAMGAALRRGQPASVVMRAVAAADADLAAAVDGAGRNDPCPCGSGRKTKRCHGGLPVVPSGHLDDIPAHPPRPPVRPPRKGPDATPTA